MADLEGLQAGAAQWAFAKTIPLEASLRVVARRKDAASSYALRHWDLRGVLVSIPERVRTSNLLLRREPRYPVVPRGLSEVAIIH